MIPRECSSGGRQKLGGLSKQGNPLLRFLWGEQGGDAARRMVSSGSTAAN
jgi:transposase